MHLLLDLAWNSQIACTNGGPLCCLTSAKPCAEFSSVALPAVARHLLLRALPHAVLLVLSLIVASVFMESIMRVDDDQQGGDGARVSSSLAM